jgi:hypothetical protein
VGQRLLKPYRFVLVRYASTMNWAMPMAWVWGAVLLLLLFIVHAWAWLVGVASPIPSGITPEYGKYMATLGDCRACHGPDMTGTTATATLPGAPNPRPYVASLSLDQFRQMMRTGIRPTGGVLNTPWQRGPGGVVCVSAG